MFIILIPGPDPPQQTIPNDWQKLTQNQLENEIYNDTKDVMLQLKNQSTNPDFIQVGNETDSGFLWNNGRVWG
ncbi:MAG: glycosyl hydrolase 53 family protein [Flavobacterium sp.]|nr:glycosyl hydrolase 53 family protein [Flavobacterium sp.]